LLNNAEAIADVIMSGVCKRYPGLKFVSVESGFGWVPAFVESMDWQWLNSGASKAYPDYEMPSEYFRRQVFGMFWFEHDAVRRIMDLYPDNLMFETDFPHPTSLSPGPASAPRCSRGSPRTSPARSCGTTPPRFTTSTPPPSCERPPCWTDTYSTGSMRPSAG
jgi:hypothetical protein